ncbi:MAG: class I SAM-dependent methyltransferase [Bdellovibrionia bacterium]
MSDFEAAWQWRQKLGLLNHSDALRVFHGPGEGVDDSQYFAIDKFSGKAGDKTGETFGDHYWVTQWESSNPSGASFSKAKLTAIQGRIVEFLKSKNATSVVAMIRPEKGLPSEPSVWYGNPPEGRFTVQEGEMLFWIQLQNSRHPGLFLDHFPLRKWLRQTSQGKRVLNTFAYTGSLSVAAGLGGAESVTTLDLSKPSVDWAIENFKLNKLADSKHRAISGDVFEWLPRLKREKQIFDCIILDPPSFSHGKKQNFSTAKDLEKLHFLAIELLARGGILITSINSANITWKKYEFDLLAASKRQKVEFKILKQIDLPESFPTRLGNSQDRYLKGWILQNG